MPVPTSGIDHVHLNVEDIHAATDLFTTILECEHNIPLYIDSIQALNSMSTLMLDVFQPQGSDGITAKQMARFGGPGLTTLSFHVEDIESASAHIESCGVPILSQIGFPGVEIQTQFRPRDCFGMVLELVQYEPTHDEVIARIKDEQAREHGGRRSIPAKPGALSGRGIDHVHLRVDDLPAAQRWFSKLFVCDWDEIDTQAGDPSAARSSIGMHLVEAKGQKEGLGSVAFGVHDLAAAKRLADRLGLRRVDASDHSLRDDCLRLDPDDIHALPLELVQVR